MAATMHTFVTNDLPGEARIYFAPAPPTAADGNNYAVGDQIYNRQIPYSTAITPGTPMAWICVVSGTGATAQWAEFGGASQAVFQSSVTAPATVTASLTGAGDTLLKFTIPFGALPAGASPQSISLFTPPAKSLVYRVFTKHSVAFAGGALSGLTVKVGVVGNTAAYSPAFDIFQAVAANTFQIASIVAIDSWTAPAAVVATFTSTGANPNAATAGSVDIYVWISVARS